MNSNEKKLNKSNRLLFLFAMFVVGAGGILVYLAMTGNTFQKFTDIVIEYTSIHASNKSAERNLFYIFSTVGAVIYTIYYFVTQGKNIDNTNEGAEKVSNDRLIIIALAIFSGMYYFVYQGSNWLLLAALVVGLGTMWCHRKLVIPSVAFVFVNSYAIFGLYRLHVMIGGKHTLNINIVALVSMIVSFILLGFSKKVKDLFQRGILISQLFLPFTLLVYLSSNYLYHGEIKYVSVPLSVKLLIFTLILLFLLEAFIVIWKNWRSTSMKLSHIISYGMCVSILAFNGFFGSGAIISTDLHHPFENIIGFSQMLQLGQKAFTEYIPVSGMYSVLQGGLFWLFGNGQASNYYLTENVFYLIVILLVIYLLKKQVKAEWVLFIAFTLEVIDYNRVSFILPIMLLLVWPKLIKNKNLWLKIWYLTSFFHTLYYPVFGAAVCVSYLPLGIWQILSYAKSGELQRDMKKTTFWIWWIICSIPVVIGFPYIIGTAKHMLAMAGQTVYADGITRFGQLVSDSFMAYIPNYSLRLIAYYIFSYLIVIGIVWVSTALCLQLGKFQIQKGKIKIEKPIPAFIVISVAILMLISISYTVIRFDVNSIYARSIGVVYAIFVITILLLDRYVKEYQRKKCVLIWAAILIGAVCKDGVFTVDTSVVLEPYYTVPGDYVYVENDKIERLGTGFVQNDMYDNLENTYDSVAGLNREDTYLGIVSKLGEYYLCNLKGDSVIETGTIKGFGAAQETVDILRKQKTIVGADISSISNYYLYYWLVTSGEYVWSEELCIFLPNDGSVSKEEIWNQNKKMPLSADKAGLGRTAGSWGASMDTLNDIFHNANVKYIMERQMDEISVTFEQDINGSDADFVYIEFENMDNNPDYTLFNLSDSVIQDAEGSKLVKYVLKYLMKKDYNRNLTVVVSWNGEDGNTYSMNCSMSHGKLLLPLGGGSGWLLNNHSNISISVFNEYGEMVEVPEIYRLEFLKVREVQ